LFLELIVGALFVLTYFATLGEFGAAEVYSSVFVATLAYRLFLISVLFVIFFIDLRHSIIPFAAVASAFVVSLIWMIVVSPSLLLGSIFAALGSFLFFFMIHAVTKGKGMGFGDVIFSFFMGFLLGFPTVVVAIYIAFLTGSVLSLILILAKRKKLKSAIPFGPFLVAGTVSCLLWGSQLTHAFLVLLHII
jgi:leader peptidase (prepilin peptidase)/N-methyltransferase